LAIFSLALMRTPICAAAVGASMPTPDVDPMAKWRDLVGGFILAFGEIEL
jgi:hypothetical protein